METTSLFSLFWIFAYIGLVSVGGGLTGISIMQQELIPRGLIDIQDFYSMVAVSESTPGPIGVNMATFIGYKLYGVWGGIITTCGMVLPSFVIILIIALFAKSLKEKPIVQKFFYGIRAGSTGMIAVACYSVLCITVLTFDKFSPTKPFSFLDIRSTIFFVLALLILKLFKKIHPLFIVALGAIFGILFL
ncbi:MAG: chromate transporter [Treponemataceae bacterium]